MTVSVSLNDNRLVITGDTYGHVSLLRSLPDARWNPAGKVWTCMATPASAGRLRLFELTASVREMYANVQAGDGEKVCPGELLPSRRHQRLALGFSEPLESPMLGMWMGTGKSKVALDWLTLRESRLVLILCPLAVVNVWPNQFATHRPEPWLILPLDKGSVARKASLIGGAVDTAARTKQRLAVVLNYDSARVDSMAKLLLSIPWDTVVCDESHRGKSPGGLTGKLMFNLAKRVEKRLCLTGTPMPHSPADIFAQYRFLDAGIFGTSYRDFMAQYAVLDRQFPSRVLRWKNMDDFEAKLRLLMFRCGPEVLDMPEVTHHRIPTHLPPRARKVYEDLEDELIAEVDSGEITVANALVKLLRLQQITSGYVTDDNERHVVLHDEKARALSDILEDLPPHEPVVVFAKFRPDLDAIAEVARKHRRKYGEVSGRTKDGLNANAEMREDLDLLGVQIQSGGVGINLVRAAYVVFWSLGYSLGDYEQAVARVQRQGQTRPVQCYHLTCQDSVDERVEEAIADKREIVEAVLASMKGATREHARS